MVRILFVGESWFISETHTKGFDSFVTSRYVEAALVLRDALSRDGFELTYMPSHVAANLFPNEINQLDAFDVVIFSDIGSNTLLLPPSVFVDGQQAPNRLEVLRDWIAAGGGFAMAGGYMSFQGFEGKANYATSALADALPVMMFPGDDRVEAPEGAVARVSTRHKILEGIKDDVWPALLGYQKVLPRPGARVLVAFDEDPLVVIGDYGDGRTMAFTSDVDAHWAPELFTSWSGFVRFWRQAVVWLSFGEE